MTASESYRYFLNELKRIYSSSEAATITDMVFEKVAGLTRSGLIKDPSILLDAVITKNLDHSLLELKDHKPVQYVLGEAWFYQMKLKVSPAVLIPRPETEELVASVIDHLKDNPAASLLDIGTGSGCIVIAIKKNAPGIKSLAIDVSKEALDIATCNATEQNTGIEFVQMDFLNETAWASLPMFNVIVSNPPYIPKGEKELLDKNVTAFEPHLALFVEDDDALIFYEKIALFGETHLSAGGKIFMETHETFAEQASALFNNETYMAEIKNDMNGKQRMVIATLRSR